MAYIYGERIRLRAPERSDIPMFVEWFGDPDVVEHLQTRLPMGLADEEVWFDNMLKRPLAEHPWVIEVKQDEAQPWKAIGNIHFLSINHVNRASEIGIVIGDKNYWDKGYGTDAMRTMVRYGFEQLNLYRIFLRVHAGNDRGIHAYKKVGFVMEGTQRAAHFQNGQYQDVYMMSILRPEWDEKQSVKG